MTSWRRLWDGPRLLGHALFYAVMICVFVSFIVMGIIGWVERDRQVYWGTFTATSSTCDPGPRGSCTSVGRWLSTDGTIVKDGVTLDGVPGADGVVRASYQPCGPMGDDENNIVHTATWSTAGLWFPWATASLTAGAIWYYHRQWRRVGGKKDRSPSSPSSQSTLATPDTHTLALAVTLINSVGAVTVAYFAYGRRRLGGLATTGSEPR